MLSISTHAISRLKNLEISFNEFKVNLRILPLSRSVPCAFLIKKLANNRGGSRFPKYQNLGHFILLFTEDSQEMYTDLSRTCTAIVLVNVCVVKFS